MRNTSTLTTFLVALLSLSSSLLSVSAAPTAASLARRTDHAADDTHQCPATGYGFTDCAQAFKCVGTTQVQACQYWDMSTGDCTSDGWVAATTCPTGTSCVAKGTATTSFPSGVMYDQCINTVDQ